MQRIALGGVAILTLIAGCASSGRQPVPGSLPDPILSTRPVQTVKALPRPEPVAPEWPVIHRLPGASGVSANSIRVPRGIDKRRWTTIVVHHSAAPQATPVSMHRYHLKLGWDRGLGYHFVIGNGTNYPDGQLYVGPRWRKQQTGAHCKTKAGRYAGSMRSANYFNEHGIGICLIGNFEQTRPTAAQMRTLRDLIAVLVREVGINPAHVYGHGEITGKTACPGRLINMAALRRDLRVALEGELPAMARLTAANRVRSDAAVLPNERRRRGVFRVAP